MRRLDVLVLLLIVMTIGCGGSKSVVEKMLEKAKRGEDTGEYWVDGVARQKLYNVIDYEIMSERPLAEAMKQYLPKALEHHKASIMASDKTIAEINEQAEKYRSALPSLNTLALIDSPYHIENDTVGNFNRMVDALKSYRQQYPNDGDINQAITYINQAADWLEKAQKYSQGRGSSSLTEQVLGYAEESIEKSYSSFREVVRKNRELRDTAMEAVNSAPKRIDEERTSQSKSKLAMSELEALVANRTGVAYKVKINSTNKAGQPIVWIWTITVVRPEKEWQVSYLYNEEEFGEEKNSQKMNAALISVFGK